MEGFYLLRQLGTYLGAEMVVIEDEVGCLDESFLAMEELGAEIIGSAVRFFGESLELEEVRLTLERGFIISIGSDPKNTYARQEGDIEDDVWGDYLMVWGKRPVRSLRPDILGDWNDPTGYRTYGGE